MRRRYWFRGLAVWLSVSLVSGCAGRLARPVHHPPVKTEAAEAKRDTTDDQPAQRLAQAHAHYAAGVIHEMNEEREAALEEYYQAASEDPANEEMLLDVSGRFLQNKQPEKALELLNRATASPHASGDLFARLGLIYSQLGKPEQASAADRQAIKRAPASLAGYQNLVLIYLQAKQDQEAFKVLEEAYAQPTVTPEFLLGLSDLYGSLALQSSALKEKANARLLTVLRRADRLNPSSATSRLKLADSFSALGETARAAQIYLDLLKKLPDMPMIRERVHAKLAGIYLRGSDGRRAGEQLQAILRDDPTNPQVYYYLGRIAYEEKKPAEAAEYLRKAVMLNPDFQEAYFYLAVAQLGANQTSDALATLEIARRKSPQNFDLELWTGLAYSQQKAYPEALRHFTEAEVIAKATDPSRLNYEFYFQVGAASERSGNYAQAADNFEKCLRANPDSSEAMNYLGYMWAEHGTNLVRARDLIEKAVKAEPKNGAYLDSLGWVLFKLGQPQQALAQVLKALSLSDEPDPTEYEHLGDIYLELKQPEKAREAWVKSLALEPNEPLRKKLESLAPSTK